MITLCVLIGLSLAVIYPDDPYKSGEIKSYDQLLTYYVKSWQGWDGFLGLYSASLYSGAISTVSSSQAVLAQLTLDDFIKPIFKIDDRQALRISRLLMVFYGGLAVLLAWVASHLGDLLRPTGCWKNEPLNLKTLIFIEFLKNSAKLRPTFHPIF